MVTIPVCRISWDFLCDANECVPLENAAEKYRLKDYLSALIGDVSALSKFHLLPPPWDPGLFPPGCFLLKWAIPLGEEVVNHRSSPHQGNVRETLSGPQLLCC